MGKANNGRLQTSACQNPTHANKRSYQQFHLLPIGMSGNAKIAQGNGEISGLKAVQNDACIDDRTVALSPIERLAKRF